MIVAASGRDRWTREAFLSIHKKGGQLSACVSRRRTNFSWYSVLHSPYLGHFGRQPSSSAIISATGFAHLLLSLHDDSLASLRHLPREEELVQYPLHLVEVVNQVELADVAKVAVEDLCAGVSRGRFTGQKKSNAVTCGGPVSIKRWSL